MPTSPYTIDGVRVPSVTQVIGENLGWDKSALIAWARREGMAGRDPYAGRDRAAAIGTLTHLLVQRHADPGKVTIDWSTWTPADRGVAEKGLEAFDHWAAQHTIETVATEIPLVSLKHRYGGTLDWVVRIDGIKSYMDFKTSKGIYPGHKIQVAAYLNLWHETHGEWLQPHILHLSKDTGDFQHHLLSNLQPYLAAFFHLLELNKLKQELA